MLGEAEESAQAEGSQTFASAFSISQQIVDEVLTSGGNEENSTLRIAAYFKKDHSVSDNATYLQREYGTGGKGFVFGGNHVSVWFDQSGLYAEKADAGRAIIETCRAMTSPDPVPLGEYRGFNMILSFDSYGKEYRVTLSGALSHTVKLGTDIHGNITRLDNALEGFADALRQCEGQLENVQTQLEAAKGEVGGTFPQEQEYAEKSARLKEVNILLNMNEKDHEIFDAEPDEGDVEPPQRTPGRER